MSPHPVTHPVCTLVDIASCLHPDRVERAVNEADRLALTNPEELRTDSELERRFLRLVRKAGMPTPQTGFRVNGVKVDFYWGELGLVVETDDLRYHRTPAEQTKDRARDQTHTAAGLVHLRFTHAQVTFEQEYVIVNVA